MGRFIILLLVCVLTVFTKFCSESSNLSIVTYVKTNKNASSSLPLAVGVTACCKALLDSRPHKGINRFLPLFIEFLLGGTAYQY